MAAGGQFVSVPLTRNNATTSTASAVIQTDLCNVDSIYRLAFNPTYTFKSNSRYLSETFEYPIRRKNNV